MTLASQRGQLTERTQISAKAREQLLEHDLIRTRRRRVRVGLDGEIELVESPLAFRSLPLALTVLAPPVAAEPTLTVEVTEEV